VILQTAASQAANLIIIGGHGQRPLVHRLRGSTVHDLLEGTSLPVLICC
jgi:nucleotide-binding universal stress UspA family protein